MVANDRMEFINDYGTLEKFSNFLVEYALDNLPELTQIDLGIKIEERLKLSRERALYLPNVGLNGSTNSILGRINIPEGLPEINTFTTWDIGLGVSYPIFQGNSRRKLIEQSKLSIAQFQDTRKDVTNQLEVLIRANIESVGASFSRMDLSQAAADASQKNFEIVKDAYSAGHSNITTLIDAQNNALATNLNSINAVYTFILDFLSLERSIGFYSFLSTSTVRDDFLQKASEYIK